jgi:phosphate starvation-inducible PhoH-like protein
MSRKRQKLQKIKPPKQGHDVYLKQGVTARTKHQKEYIKSINRNKLTICTGPAGTGKTYIASALALMGMKNDLYDQIIITRPMVQAGEETGFLPGGIESKLKPYLKPIYDEMRHFIDIATIKRWLAEEKIEIVPFAYMRGRNFHHSFIIADECQNATKEQLKMLVTRYGVGSKLVLSGDFTQSDLPVEKAGGLRWLVDKIAPRMIRNGSSTGVVELDNTDIVREQLVEDFVLAIQEEEDEKKASKNPSS